MEIRFFNQIVIILSLAHVFCATASQPPAKKHRTAPRFSIAQTGLENATSSQIITQLIQNGADLYKKDAAGDTVLHKAIKRGNTATIEALLTYECTKVADNQENQLILQENAQGLLPLHLAAQQGLTAALDIIIQKYPDINYNYPLKNGTYKNCTPLDLACMFAHQDTVHYLLNQENIIIDTRLLFKNIPQDYATPLYHACTQRPQEISAITHKQRTSIAQLILENIPESLHIPCGALQDTALHRACIHGNKELATLLLFKNAPITAIDNQGMTPYMRLQTITNQREKNFIAKLLYLFGHMCPIAQETATDEDKLVHAMANADTEYLRNYDARDISPLFASILYIFTILRDSYNNSNMLNNILQIKNLNLKQVRAIISHNISLKTKEELIQFFVHEFNAYLQKNNMYSSNGPKKDVIIEFLN